MHLPRNNKKALPIGSASEGVLNIYNRQTLKYSAT